MDALGTKNPWVIGPAEQLKYDNIFDGLVPIEGRVSGEKCKSIFLNSKLPVDVLGRVWDLSDIDKDGFLDRDEFRVAMHLVYKALEKEPIPATLPPSLMPMSKRPKVAIPPTYPIPGLSTTLPMMSGHWVVSATDKVMYDDLFWKADLDKDGFVDGGEIKDTFLQSGLPPVVLARVWALCDIRNNGKLNNEQFALAMYLIKQKLAGVELPPQLAPDMVPPSFRHPAGDPMAGLDPGFGLDSGAVPPPMSNELLMFQKEIENIKRDKMRVEQERLQLQMDAAACTCELDLLQKELDALVMTTKQLDTQKGEARKRLDELEDRKVKLDFSAKEARTKCAEEEEQIARLKRQTDDEDNSAKRQESELKRMKDELGRLRSEELELEQRIDASKSQVDQLTRTLSDTQSAASQMRNSIPSMQQVKDKLIAASRQYTALINREPGATEPSLDGLMESTYQNGFHDKAFASNGFGSAAFGTGQSSASSRDAFATSDPFHSASGSVVHDPFSSADPFSDMSTSVNSRLSQDVSASFGLGKKSNDPFGGGWDAKPAAPAAAAAPSSDPWGFASFSSTSKTTMGDPFGSSAFGAQELTSPINPGDPFGTGAFGSGGANNRKKSPAPPRPSSAAGAASSKNKKAPPPPRPPAPKKGDDPFGGDPFGGSSSFADFGVQGGDAAPTEDAQMAWALEDSKRDWEQNELATQQENAELDLALEFSRRH